MLRVASVRLLLLLLLLGVAALFVDAAAPFRGHNTVTGVTGGAGTSYDAERAKRGVYLARVSSCMEPDIPTWNCTLCVRKDTPTLESAQVFKHTSLIDTTFGYVGYDKSENSIVVAFRGTDSIQDWLTDVDFFLKPFMNYTEEKAHEGFVRAYKFVEVQLKASFKKYLDAHPTAKVEIVGHSLGGALTTIAGIDLTDSFNLQDVTVISYGAPRVGNLAFSQLFAKRVGTSWRVVHWDDIVPTVPLKGMGFHHVGTEILYNLENTSYQVCNGSGEDPKCERRGFSTKQHGNYLGIEMICPGASTYYFMKGAASDM